MRSGEMRNAESRSAELRHAEFKIADMRSAEMIHADTRRTGSINKRDYSPFFQSSSQIQEGMLAVATTIAMPRKPTSIMCGRTIGSQWRPNGSEQR